MITKIEVEGFKSLSGFELNLKPGLNILVGPNGVGKTNIILFFEFLSKLATKQLGNAVSSIGGAGSIFKKIGAEGYQDEINFKIFGSKRVKAKKFIVYEFQATISASFLKDTLIFKKQSIKIRTASKFWADPNDNFYKSSWDFDLRYQRIGKENEIKFHRLDKRKFKSKFRFERDNESASLEETLEAFIGRNSPTNNLIIQSLFPVILDYANLILSDLIGGETLNIEPSKVKEREDAATPPGIKKNGAGLSTTLYSMQKTAHTRELDFRYFFFSGEITPKYIPELIDKIVNYLRLANSSITGLQVINDNFDNRLIVKINIESGDYSAVLPLASMSDGTIKWLTLITAILTSNTIFSIEEPENFLHPWMQAEILNIMREHIDTKKDNSFAILTTHSESLLNASNPEEVILVDLNAGNTVAKRINNLELLKTEISSSGFGLGYFYYSNALADE